MSDLYSHRQTEPLTTDQVFASSIVPILQSGLAQVPERHYASAKVILCDRPSYDFLTKLKRLSESISMRHQHLSKNFLYRRPLSVTAVLLLSDIKDLFDRESEPLILLKTSSTREGGGGQAVNLNYPLVRRVFPLIKMTDLVVMLVDASQLQLGVFDLKASREKQIIQVIGKFARSISVVDLRPLHRLIGQLHPILDNVLIYQPQAFTMGLYRQLSIASLSSLAERVVAMTIKLRLRPESIYYRLSEPHKQTEIFSKLVSTIYSSQGATTKTTDDQGDRRAVRILVLDRFYDLKAPLYHADRYGAFIEQESQLTTAVAGASLPVDSYLRMDNTMAQLDELLHCQPLSQVLGVLIKFALNLRPRSASTSVARGKLSSPTIVSLSAARRRVVTSGGQQNTQPASCSSSLVSESQSVRRHLDLIKAMYRRLSQGYLLLLRLESSLQSVDGELRLLKAPLGSHDQATEVVAKLERISAALNQLAKTSGSSRWVGSLNMLRVACALIDVINLFLCLHERTSDRKSCSKARALRDSLLSGAGDFRRALKAKLEQEQELEQELEWGSWWANHHDDDDDNDDGLRPDANLLMAKLRSFDRLSRELAAHKSPSSLEGLLVDFRRGARPDEGTFARLELGESPNRKSKAPNAADFRQAQADPIATMMVFVGALSPAELSRAKHFEPPSFGLFNASSTTPPHESSRPSPFYLLVGELCGPRQFIANL